MNTCADNAATCPAGAAIVAIQSWAIKLYIYMYHKLAGESLPYVDSPACLLCMALTCHMSVRFIMWKLLCMLKIIIFAPSLIQVDVTVAFLTHSQLS